MNKDDIVILAQGLIRPFLIFWAALMLSIHWISPINLPPIAEYGLYAYLLGDVGERVLRNVQFKH